MKRSEEEVRERERAVSEGGNTHAYRTPADMENRPAPLRSRRVCRFCLTESEPLSYIYERDHNKPFQVPLTLQIMSCVAIEVSEQRLSRRLATRFLRPARKLRGHSLPRRYLVF